MKIKKILIYSANTYNFDEYLLGIINKLFNEFHEIEITLIQNSFFIDSAKKILNTLESLKKNKNFHYEIYEIYSDNNSIQNHYNYINILNKIFHNKYDILITQTDSYLFDKYLLHFSRKNNLKTILIHCNTLDRNLLKKNYKLFCNFKEEINSKNNNKLKLNNKLIIYLKFFFKLIKYKIAQLIELKIIPKFFLKTFFYKNLLDDYIIPSGHTDYIFTLDKIDYILTKKLTNKKNVFLIEHPIKYVQNFEIKKNTLLVALNNYKNEYYKEEIDEWISILKKLITKHKIEKINIKFHPRTDYNATWKNYFLSLLPKNKQIKIFDNNNYSFHEIFNAEVIVSPFSGVLRSISNITENNAIYCLMNMGKNKDDYDFYLGYSPRVKFINSKNISYNLKIINQVETLRFIEILKQI